MLRFVQAERGQDLIEYAMLAGLISVMAVAAIGMLGQAIHSALWQTIVNNF